MSKVTKAAMKAAIKQKALLERMLDENLVLDGTANDLARQLAFSMVYEEGLPEAKMRKLKQKSLLKRYADVQDEMFARDFRMSLMNEDWENIVWQ